MAGAITRAGGPQPSTRLCNAISEHLVRAKGSDACTISRPGVWLAHRDLGALGGSSTHVDADGSATLLCGEAVLEHSRAHVAGERGEEIRSVHAAFLRESWAAFRNANGVFSAVHVSPDRGSIHLATDHLGVRPLYLYRDRDLAVFSSVLRLFPLLPGISLSVDSQGLLETVTRGYAYGARTPFREVRRISAAEVWTLSADLELESHVYHRWDEARLPEVTPVDHGMVREIAERFHDAVRIRNRDDRAAWAFLSGGLDSRAIVAVLRDLGTEVHSQNFSIPGEQDEVYARAFADRVGAVHSSHPRSFPVRLSQGEWSHLMRRAITERGGDVQVNRPRLAWSGDGGSVGLGGSAGLSDSIARRLRDGDIEGAARLYAPKVPVGLVRRSAQSSVRARLADAVCQELEALAEPEPVGRFLTFLLLHDQRRHLDGHFEELDRHRIELALPFFDAGLLKLIHSLPASAIRGHALYHRVLEELPQSMRSVPWQTYPGHLPCPVPWESELPAQWDTAESRARRRVRRREWSRELGWGCSMILSVDFPTRLLSRVRLGLVTLAHALRIRDYGYAIAFARRVVHHAREVRNPGLARWSDGMDPRTPE